MCKAVGTALSARNMTASKKENVLTKAEDSFV
jgi:hypothetical protein